jgi:hypothetical protein
MRTPAAGSDKHGYQRQSEVRFSVENVRFAPENGHVQCDSPCLLWAKSGHSIIHSIKSSAMESSPWRHLDAEFSRRLKVDSAAYYFRAFASASSFSSWLTRSCSANKRELSSPTLKNVTLLAGASRVLP